MAVCSRTRFKKKFFCLGDFRWTISVETRSIQPLSTSVDYQMSTTSTTSVKSIVETTSGVDVFGDVNIVGVATHKFIIRFMTSVDITTHVVFKSKRFRVLRVENIDEESRYLRLLCSERGQQTLSGAQV